VFAQLLTETIWVFAIQLLPAPPLVLQITYPQLVLVEPH
jgi:hypothetical protein